MNRLYFTQRKLLVSLLFLVLSLSAFAQSTIYVGGHIRREREKAIPNLKNSGFTCAILFNIQVEENGDLTTDNELICSDGVYRFNEVHPHYIDDVNSLLTGKTSITRLETCIGGWGSPSYNNIRKLIQEQGTGPNSILYRNFKAFKETIPVIEAVNNDDEHTYDVDVAFEFHAMLYELGYKTTIAPYHASYKSFWIGFANKLNEKYPGAIDRNYVQCYDGGKSNNPADWIIGDIPLHAGGWVFDSPGYITSQMNTWKKEAPVVGGFLWVYNDEDRNLRNYSSAINIIFGGGEVINMDEMTPHVIAYTEKDYKGHSMPFEVGSHTSYALKVKDFQPENLSSVYLNEGFTLEIFYQEDGRKRSVVIEESIPDIEALALPSDPTNWTVAINGSQSIVNNKIYYLKNHQTSLYLTPEEYNTTNGTLMQQKPLSGSKNQQWTFGHLGKGSYRILNASNSKTLEVIEEEENKGLLMQNTYSSQKDNQKFIAVHDEQTNSYKFIGLSTLGYLSVVDESEEAGAYIRETLSRESASTDWELIAADEVSINEVTNGLISVYPIPANNILYLESAKAISKVIITDISGTSLIIKENTESGIDISSLSDGIYILTIMFEDNTPSYVTKISKRIK